MGVLGAANVQSGGQPQSWRHDRSREEVQENVLRETESISIFIVLFGGRSFHRYTASVCVTGETRNDVQRICNRERHRNVHTKQLTPSLRVLPSPALSLLALSA